MCISREEVLLEYTIVASIRNYRCLHIINTLTFLLRQRVMHILNVIAIIRSFYLFWEVNFEIALSRSCSTLFVVRFILCPVSSSDSAESTSPNHWVKISLSRSLVIFETCSRLSYIVRFDIFTLFLEVSRKARILALMNHTA